MYGYMCSVHTSATVPGSTPQAEHAERTSKIASVAKEDAESWGHEKDVLRYRR